MTSFVCSFLWLKNKSKPRWCLAVSTVFNKRSFTTILRIVIVIYPYTLDPLKKYRKSKWLDDLFTPYFVHRNRHLRSIFEYLKINKTICIQNWCVIPVYLHIIGITWHFRVLIWQCKYIEILLFHPKALRKFNVNWFEWNLFVVALNKLHVHVP